jgi:hypothetical protein
LIVRLVISENEAMSIILVGLLLAVLVAGSVFCMLEFGRVVGRRRRLRGEEPLIGGAIEGAVFAIFGLLVAFTFSGAASRFEDRRALITQEANAIGTAWLRLDLLPVQHQPAIRDDFRHYVDARLTTYHSELGETVSQEMSRIGILQGALWSKIVPACHADSTPSTTTLVLPALNDVFDIATTRLVAKNNHPPVVIFLLLIALALTCSFMAGLDMAQERQNRIHQFGFALVIATTLYVIMDLEFPRLGFIRIDAADQLLFDVRASMGPVSAVGTAP